MAFELWSTQTQNTTPKLQQKVGGKKDKTQGFHFFKLHNKDKIKVQNTKSCSNKNKKRVKVKEMKA